MKPAGSPSSNDRTAAARRRAALAHEAERRRLRRRRALWIGGGVAVAIAAAVLATPAIAPPASSAGGGPVSGTVGPEGIALESGPPLAANTTSTSGATADGIGCAADEQVAYHIHTHLAVYVDGSPRSLPAGIGIVAPLRQPTRQGEFDSATTCYYWLHVHARDGVIHIEAPTRATVTLGQFFAVWRQPLTATRVAGVAGRLTVFVNGRPVAGDPARIVLRSREDIQIDVGRPVPFHRVDWSRSNL